MKGKGKQNKGKQNKEKSKKKSESSKEESEEEDLPKNEVYINKKKYSEEIPNIEDCEDEEIVDTSKKKKKFSIDSSDFKKDPNIEDDLMDLFKNERENLDYESKVKQLQGKKKKNKKK